MEQLSRFLLVLAEWDLLAVQLDVPAAALAMPGLWSTWHESPLSEIDEATGPSGMMLAVGTLSGGSGSVPGISEACQWNRWHA
jgi:hypothetical protein